MNPFIKRILLSKRNNKNLFNKNNITVGYVNASGTITAAGTTYYTEYYEIYGRTQYTVSGRTFNHSAGVCLAFYDSNKAFISSASMGGFGDITATSPSNAKYIRISVNIIEIDTVQLEASPYATNYVEFRR